ncbi:MAG: hypothetical protein JSV04_14685, partial [Candidatus Heimdallarchaeota archaeon]
SDCVKILRLFTVVFKRSPQHVYEAKNQGRKSNIELFSLEDQDLSKFSYKWMLSLLNLLTF